MPPKPPLRITLSPTNPAQRLHFLRVLFLVQYFSCARFMMFDGKVKSTRQISYSGRNAKTDPKSAKDLVENARKQREARAQDRQRNLAATKVQKLMRSKHVRIKTFRVMRTAFDNGLPEAAKNPSLEQISRLVGMLVFFFNIGVDVNRLLAVNHIVISENFWDQLILLVRRALSAGPDTLSLLAQLRPMGLLISLVMQSAAQLAASNQAAVSELVKMLATFNQAQSTAVEERLLGAVVSLYAARSAAKCLSSVTESPDAPLVTALMHEAKGALVQGLGWVKDNAFAGLPGDVKDYSRNLRQVGSGLCACP
jgi:hypothetical protein